MSQIISYSSLGAMLSRFNLASDKEDEYYDDALYELSTAIFKKRLDMKMNQSEFAKLLGVSQAMVSKYESGDYNFTVKQLCHLAEKLGMIPQISLFDAIRLSPNNYEPKSSYIDATTEKRIEEAA